MAEPKSVEFSKYLDLYESNASSKLVQKRERTALYGDVNKALYEWYLLAVSKNIYPDGTQLILKAKEIANRIDVHELNLDETGCFWKALPLCLQKDLDRKLRSVKVARNLSCESQLPSLSMLRGKRKN